MRASALLLSGLLLMPLTAEQPTHTPNLEELNRMAARFASVPLHVDTSKLSAGDAKALPKLLEAARAVDDLFLKQFWSGNPAEYHKLKGDSSPLGKARLPSCKFAKSSCSEYRPIGDRR